MQVSSSLFPNDISCYCYVLEICGDFSLFVMIEPLNVEYLGEKQFIINRFSFPNLSPPEPTFVVIDMLDRKERLPGRGGVSLFSLRD